MGCDERRQDIQRRFVDEPVPSLLLLLPPSDTAQGSPYSAAIEGAREVSHDYKADLSFFVAEVRLARNEARIRR